MRASILFIATVGLGLVACGAHRSGPDTDGLDSESAALLSDSAEVDETEESLELGVEDTLSGASPASEVDVVADGDALADKARTNAGLYFKPAGCIVSTRALNVVTHVFTNCTGPHGLVSYNGTVTSTWTKIANGAQVVHATTGFKINGATVDHGVTIQYTKASGIYTKTRKGSSTGTTAKGHAIKHSANYVTKFDANTRCITRDGSSNTSVGLREWSRSIAGFERCGVGLNGCPNSGTITIDTPRRDVTLSFPGGAEVDITVDGKKFRRALFCSAAAS